MCLFLAMKAYILLSLRKNYFYGDDILNSEKRAKYLNE